MKQTIIDFWRIGFQAFPLVVSKNELTGKKQLDWKPTWGETLSLSLVLDWLNFLGDSCNAVAVKTGLCSNLFVLDLDVTNGKDGGTAIERHGIMIPAKTVSARTQSGGLHYYFRFPKDLENSTGTDLFEKASGIDIRGEGGFVIAPPSRVKGGGEYSWIVSPFEYPLAPLPEGMLKIIIAARNRPEPCKMFWKQGTEKRIYELTYSQKQHLMKRLEKSRSAEIGFRSHADFALCCWAVNIRLAVYDLWELCRDIGKFRECGRAYFDLTYNNALKTNRPHPGFVKYGE
jgi:hypothetical protein